MTVVILCGGKGTRLTERTEHIPKPLVEIGDQPILWHIMKMYAHFGFTDFVLCLGYKGEKIREYFTAGHEWHYIPAGQPADGSSADRIAYGGATGENWRITFLETGPETNTGGRVLQAQPYIDGDTFFATYGDGVANVDLAGLRRFHGAHGRIATLTAVQPYSQFGILKLDDEDGIQRFEEKPRLDAWVNGGFFVFNRRIFDYLGPDDILERQPFERLASDGQIMAFRHSGFWECMDTFKDTMTLNALWENNQAAWKMWDEIAV